MQSCRTGSSFMLWPASGMLPHLQGLPVTNLLTLQSAQAANAVATEAALGHLRDCARLLLGKHSGYECQEADGEFMLAFHDSWQACLFCLRVSPTPCNADSSTLDCCFSPVAGCTFFCVHRQWCRCKRSCSKCLGHFLSKASLAAACSSQRVAPSCGVDRR